jgi:hypothetical protein
VRSKSARSHGWEPLRGFALGTIRSAAQASGYPGPHTVEIQRIDVEFVPLGPVDAFERLEQVLHEQYVDLERAPVEPGVAARVVPSWQ